MLLTFFGSNSIDFPFGIGCGVPILKLAFGIWTFSNSTLLSFLLNKNWFGVVFEKLRLEDIVLPIADIVLTEVGNLINN